jgi:hypothetical protein
MAWMSPPPSAFGLAGSVGSMVSMPSKPVSWFARGQEGTTWSQFVLVIVRPFSAAQSAICVREVKSSFVRMCSMWAATVR